MKTWIEFPEECANKNWNGNEASFNILANKMLYSCSTPRPGESKVYVRMQKQCVNWAKNFPLYTSDHVF